MELLLSVRHCAGKETGFYCGSKGSQPGQETFLNKTATGCAPSFFPCRDSVGTLRTTKGCWERLEVGKPCLS